jgi:hypothetical protein
MVMGAVGAVAGAAATVAGALGLLKPTKARLVCKDDNLPDGEPFIECMFNPTEYRLTQTLTVSRSRSTTTDGGTPEFSGTNAMTLVMQLFFDDFASPMGDVTPKITTLLSWTKPTARSRSQTPPLPRPPQVGFAWGANPQLAGFWGYLTNVVVNYTVFSMSGTPLQAKVDVTITGQQEQIGAQNPTSHSINSRRTRELIDGDSLQSVAYHELGKANSWRALAELNGIDDPQRVRSGSVLLIPTLADAAKDA